MRANYRRLLADEEGRMKLNMELLEPRLKTVVPHAPSEAWWVNPRPGANQVCASFSVYSRYYIILIPVHTVIHYFVRINFTELFFHK